MLKRLLSKNSGFTLIEIVIVLAIAGLIFVIVFLAVSQAQATRRDTQRKTDINRVVAAVNQYASNNNGNLPGTTGQSTLAVFQAAYMPSPFADPAGTNYTIAAGTVGTAPAQNTINVQSPAICSNGSTSAVSTNARNFAVVGYIERGGSVCQDSQ